MLDVALRSRGAAGGTEWPATDGQVLACKHSRAEVEETVRSTARTVAAGIGAVACSAALAAPAVATNLVNVGGTQSSDGGGLNAVNVLGTQHARTTHIIKRGKPAPHKHHGKGRG